MEDARVDIETELWRVRQLTSCDFTALALLDNDGRYYWRYVIGNSNERYKQMSVSPGTAFPGSVIRHGRLAVLNATHAGSERLRKESPIMLAEQLLAAVAAPVVGGDSTCGLLLVGVRTVRNFTDADVAHATKTTDRLKQILALAPFE